MSNIKITELNTTETRELNQNECSYVVGGSSLGDIAEGAKNVLAIGDAVGKVGKFLGFGPAKIPSRSQFLAILRDRGDID